MNMNMSFSCWLVGCWCRVVHFLQSYFSIYVQAIRTWYVNTKTNYSLNMESEDEYPIWLYPVKMETNVERTDIERTE